LVKPAKKQSFLGGTQSLEIHQTPKQEKLKYNSYLNRFGVCVLPDKKFLENFPLYKVMRKQVSERIDQIPKPPISFYCDTCGSIQTYIMVNEYWNEFTYTNFPSNNVSLKASYLCVSCNEHRRDFFIHISDDLQSFQKIGQNPPWGISGDKNIEKMLGEHKEHLKRGMICESQGYGIGAFGYYRRITEEIIDTLISDIEAIIPVSDRASFSAALEKVKTTRQTSEKIAFVKDLLPLSLKIEGMNPLGILHSSLSEGLHSKSDQECLNFAEAIRVSLVYLASQLSESRNQKAEFTTTMQKILDKK
jgi:hypothetical protein